MLITPKNLWRRKSNLCISFAVLLLPVAFAGVTAQERIPAEAQAVSGLDTRDDDPTLRKILAGEFFPYDPSLPAGSVIPTDRKFPPGKLNDWTILFYDDADFQGYDPLEDFADEVYSAKNLDVVLLQDTYDDPAFIWHLPGGGETTLLESLGEVDMGHYATLRDFILYGKEHYPAKRYILMLYDHGAGFEGACIDETTEPPSILSMDDFQVALGEAGGVDIIAFTAPCLMGAVESVYELRDVVDTYIGSEDLSGFMAWLGSFTAQCDLLVDSDDLSTGEVAVRILEITESSIGWATMTAASPDGTAEMVLRFDELAAYLADHMEELRPGVTLAHDHTTGVYPDDTPWFVDLYSFVESLAIYVPDDFVQAKADEVLQLFDQAILAEYHPGGEPGFHGLSIYYPYNAAMAEYYDAYYTGINLDFGDLHWDDFLRAFYEIEE